MSTSHYSRTDYSDLVGKPGIKSSDKNPALAQMREAVYAWEDSLSHPSLVHSRPQCSDVGADTLRLSDRIVPANIRRPRRSPLVAAVALLVMGIGLLILDGCALAHYADAAFESTVIALVSLPSAVFVVATAFVVRSLTDKH